MNQQYIAFFVIVCTVVSLYSMERDRAPEQRSGVVKIINIPAGNYGEIAFINNENVVINLYKIQTGCRVNCGNPRLINIFSEVATDFHDMQGLILENLTVSHDKSKFAMMQRSKSLGGFRGKVIVYDIAAQKKYVPTILTQQEEDYNIFFMQDKLLIQDSFSKKLTVVDYVNNKVTHNDDLKSLLEPNSYRIKAYLPKKQQICLVPDLWITCSMFDIMTESFKELSEPMTHPANILVSSDESGMLFHGGWCPQCRTTKVWTEEVVEICACKDWHSIDVETHKLIKLEGNPEIGCSATIHPNSKCAGLVSKTGVINYCSTKTGELIAQQQYPEKIDPKFFKDYAERPSNLANIAFSPDGFFLHTFI